MQGPSGQPIPFEYHALDAKSKLVSGVVTAPGRQEALTELASRGLHPLSVIERGKGAAGPFLSGKVKPEDFIQFNTHLASIAASGLPLSPGLRALAKDVGTGPFQRLVEEVASEVEAGHSLSHALATRGDVFSPLYVHLVRAGEASGDLAGVLVVAARQSEGFQEARRRIREALVYPSILLLALTGIYGFALLRVVPEFRAIYTEMDLDLPALTHLVFRFAHPLVVVTLGCLVVAALGFFWFVADRSALGRDLMDWIIGALPVVRDLRKSYDMSRFCLTLSMLLRGGAGMSEALGMVLATTPNARLRRALALTLARVQEGQKLSEALERSRGFPATLTWMLSLGEARGDLPVAFSDIGAVYQARAVRAASLLDVGLLPSVILVVGRGILRDAGRAAPGRNSDGPGAGAGRPRRVSRLARRRDGPDRRLRGRR